MPCEAPFADEVAATCAYTWKCEAREKDARVSCILDNEMTTGPAEQA